MANYSTKTVGQAFPRDGVSLEAVIRHDGRRRWTWAVLVHWSGLPTVAAHGRVDGDRAAAESQAKAGLARCLEVRA